MELQGIRESFSTRREASEVCNELTLFQACMAGDINLRSAAPARELSEHRAEKRASREHTPSSNRRWL